MYTYEYNNDVDENDEGFWTWYDILNPQGEVIARTDEEDDAKLIVAALNNYRNI